MRLLALLRKESFFPFFLYVCLCLSCLPTLWRYLPSEVSWLTNAGCTTRKDDKRGKPLSFWYFVFCYFGDVGTRPVSSSQSVVGARSISLHAAQLNSWSSDVCSARRNPKRTTRDISRSRSRALFVVPPASTKHPPPPLILFTAQCASLRERSSSTPADHSDYYVHHHNHNNYHCHVDQFYHHREKRKRRSQLRLCSCALALEPPPALHAGRRDDIRNIAIIAHVDHGKTTLVDALLKHAALHCKDEGSGIKAPLKDRVMDTSEQERTRGITILAKNTAIAFDNKKVNIVDTPGHADFGGEVERVLNMADATLLVVDAVEGPKAQTRFVLGQALKAGCEVLVVINKCDREAARPQQAVAKTFDLFVDLDASDEQTDFNTVFASALQGRSGSSPEQLQQHMTPLVDAIFKLKGPLRADAQPLQMLVSNVLFDTYKGNLAVGRVHAGRLKKGKPVGVIAEDGKLRRESVSDLFVFNTLDRQAVDRIDAGDIAILGGLSSFKIGDSVVDLQDPRPLPRIVVGEPTVRIGIMPNRSPFVGKDPLTKFVTAPQLRERLRRELQTNVSLKMDPSAKDGGASEALEVSGRGPMHLTVLLEDLRSEGYEFLVGPPDVLDKLVDGVLCEPWDRVSCLTPSEYVGGVMQTLQQRNGELVEVNQRSAEISSVNYVLPTRFTIGLRTKLLAATRGLATVEIVSESYRPRSSKKIKKEKGWVLSFLTGSVSSRGVAKAQAHGPTFVPAGTEVYKDMIIGFSSVSADLRLNVCREKHLTNMRASNRDKRDVLAPPLELSVDAAFEYIGAGEVVEVTPSAIRMAKRTAMKGTSPTFTK